MVTVCTIGLRLMVKLYDGDSLHYWPWADGPSCIMVTVCTIGLRLMVKLYHGDSLHYWPWADGQVVSW